MREVATAEVERGAIDRVLAIDPGSTLGWCVLRDGELTWGAEPFRGDFLAKLNGFDHWLVDAITRQVQPALIAVEQAGHMPGLDATLVCGGMQRLVEARAKAFEIGCLRITDSAWKKHLGLPRGVKRDAYQVRLRQLGYMVANQDEAAAVGIMLKVCADTAVRAPRVEAA